MRDSEWRWSCRYRAGPGRQWPSQPTLSLFRGGRGEAACPSNRPANIAPPPPFHTHRDDDMWHVAVLSNDLEAVDRLLIADNVVEQHRAVLFHPACKGKIRGRAAACSQSVDTCPTTHHGISYPSASACLAVTGAATERADGPAPAGRSTSIAVIFCCVSAGSRVFDGQQWEGQ